MAVEVVAVVAVAGKKRVRLLRWQLQLEEKERKKSRGERRGAAPLSSNLEEGTPIEFQEADPLKRSTPSLESERVLTLGIRAAFLASRCPFHSRPSSLHSRPKQFPQLLKRSSPNPTVIPTTADHLLISP
ncbi:hypothetical protein C4D60_Mb07t11830 [Musa balbisiana]|uniref:Uncharacterized protein n=1 Tax=Musa balbisiana TaxID=52838 RepID=A0A4S8JEV7_MUSBA|nr:hypothetical protein C4D60_Mb07t11830 [Musa balbisiana]